MYAFLTLKDLVNSSIFFVIWHFNYHPDCASAKLPLITTICCIADRLRKKAATAAPFPDTLLKESARSPDGTLSSLLTLQLKLIILHPQVLRSIIRITTWDSVKQR
jgi:hypothetical protein